MVYLKVIISGYVILVFAIVLNVVAKKLKLKTWYDFIQSRKDVTLISYLWLFIAYPVLLGLFAYLSINYIK